MLIEEGALYPALYRRARFYKLTPSGRRRLRADAATWERYATAVGQILGA